MKFLKTTALGLLFIASNARAYDPPVVRTVARIKSTTIAGRLEAVPALRDASVREAQDRMSEAIAAKIGDVFGFVKWIPEHPQAAPQVAPHAQLIVTVVEKPRPNMPSEYYLTYEWDVYVKEAQTKHDTPNYGGADPLFDPSETKPLGNQVKLALRVAAKVASQLETKRALVLGSFLSQLPLCRIKPDAESDGTFTVRVPLATMKAASESVLKVKFHAQRNLREKMATGDLQLSPLYEGEEDEVEGTHGIMQSFFFPGIGQVKAPAWDPAIGDLFKEGRFEWARVYMMTYQTTAPEPSTQEWTVEVSSQ